jgi:Cft2 family RNA processing exonuclease
MTPATRAIYKWLIQDNVRVSNTSSSSDQRTTLYTERDHLSTLPLIETIDFYTTHTINGIRITPYPAGHVLGAAMFKIDIAGLVTLFTGGNCVLTKDVADHFTNLHRLLARGGQTFNSCSGAQGNKD